MTVTKTAIQKKLASLKFDPYAAGSMQALCEAGVEYLKQRFQEEYVDYLAGNCDLDKVLQLGILILIKDEKSN